MKAVILAAGLGKRMKELTKNLPKPLIKIKNRPFLSYLLKNLQELNLDIGIVVGYKKEEIINFIKEKGIKAHFIEQKEQKGTGDAVKYIKNFVDNENFILLMGDNFYTKEDIKKLMIKDNLCYIAVTTVTNPEKYGVILEENGFLKDIIEKPQTYITNLINTGLYKLTPEIFTALEKIHISPRGEYELTDAIKLLAKQNKVKIIKINTWLDLGKPEDIKKIEEFFENAN
ncbi:hypothetical protein DRJ22_05630 [Candidatus Woesearchaeota archaeon]|nr:MAG: hypothetical protein DRJ22_05630 [Candidatus Woesearchaeota archaeon]